MQSSGTPYQGSAQHGQYGDHNYDNSMGVHCPPSGYQGYVNGPYPSRPPHPSHHHYNNHQMPPGGGPPYRGSYPPPQNQYGPPPNQEMYRNHHSGYVGANHNGNRNMPVKPIWGENNSSDMMPVYNHVPPRPQMMPNTPAMNVSSMRSPPHMSGNINPVPSPGAQHYRQMQSPGHSPQTWSQAQVPSPVMHHAARATPSPLPTHARSPGHSQPFSPPSAAHMTPMPNMTSHSVNPVLPENCQSSSINNQQVQNKGASDPLHSLQKMVMLDQNADPMQMNCHLQTENCDPVCNSSNQMVAQQHNASDESKDSNYATYFNLDENRLESEPQNSTPKPPEFVHGNEFSSHVTNNDTAAEVSQSIKSPTGPHVHSLSTPDAVFQSKESMQVVAPQTSASSITNSSENQFKGSVSHIPDSVPITEEPRLGNSAPLIGNSDQIPNSSSANSVVEPSHTELVKSESVEVHLNCENNKDANEAEIIKDSVKVEKSCDNGGNKDDPVTKESKLNCESPQESEPDLHSDANETSSVNLEKPLDVSEESRSSTTPSIVKLTVSKPSKDNEEEENEDVECFLNELLSKVGHVDNLDNSFKAVLIKEEIVSEDIVSESLIPSEVRNGEIAVILNSDEILESTALSKEIIVSELSTVNNVDLKQNIANVKSENNMPVKVVIHRIKKTNDDSNDTWQIPSSDSESLLTKQVLTNTNTSVRSGGPQIIVLSSAETRKQSADTNDNSVPTSSENKTQVRANNRTAVNKSLASKLGSARNRRNQLNARRSSSESPRNSPRKDLVGRGKGKGRIVKSKEKAGANKKKGKTKRNKKNSNIDDLEIVPKIVKKVKPFSGPYVHLSGPKQKPVAITVVNMAVKDDEKAKALMRAKPENVPKRPRVGHTSTLSPHYDAFNRDRTWLCIFCHKGSHISGLGDLYGPYYIKGDEKNSSTNSSKDKQSTPSSSRNSARSKRRKSDISESEKPSTSKKSRVSNKSESSQKNSTNAFSPSSQGTQENSVENNMKEVWIHEDCAVWCQSISLMGAQIHGLDEAIQESKENLCSSCKLSGATLGCWCKACKERYHFPCAKDKGCQLDIENFSLLCPRHKMKPPNSPRSPKKLSDATH